MKIEDFIKSGVLEEYCLGLLSVQKQTQVEKLCRKNSVIADQLRCLQEGLETYVLKKYSWENKGLKNKIWKKIEKLNTDETHSG